MNMLKLQVLTQVTNSTLNKYAGVNKWDLIFDFTKAENGQESNFSILEPSKFEIFSKTVEGSDDKPVAAFPYPQRYGGTIADDANQ